MGPRAAQSPRPPRLASRMGLATTHQPRRRRTTRPPAIIAPRTIPPRLHWRSQRSHTHHPNHPRPRFPRRLLRALRTIRVTGVPLRSCPHPNPRPHPRRLPALRARPAPPSRRLTLHIHPRHPRHKIGPPYIPHLSKNIRVLVNYSTTLLYYSLHRSLS